MKIKFPSHLSDADLTATLTSLAESTRESTTVLIAHLAEFDARRLYLGAGFSCLHEYCTVKLLFSDAEAHFRIEAARGAKKFPLILEMLAAGSLSLSTVKLLAPHLTRDNHVKLLGAASGRSKRDVEELLAQRYPRPDVPTSIRKVPAPAPMPALPVAAASASAPPVAPRVEIAPDLPAPLRRALVKPLAPERYEIRFTASGETHAKLRQAQDLLRHVLPSGDVAQVIDRALTALIADLSKKKFAATERPRPGRPRSAEARDPSATVQRAVWARDGGRCAFMAKDGRRCTARGRLEFHHVRPAAESGKPTVDNIELRCRPHNVFEAELFYSASRAGRDQVGQPTEPSFFSRKTTRPGTSRSYKPDELAPALSERPSGDSTRSRNSRNLSLWGGGT